MLSSQRLWPASWSVVAAFMLRSRSKSKTSPNRRRWRSSVLGIASTKAVTISAATSGPITRAPSVSTFTWSCSTI